MLIKMLNQLRGADAPEHGYDVTALHSFSSLETVHSDLEEMFSHISATADISSLARLLVSGTFEPVSSLEEAITDPDFEDHCFIVRGKGDARNNVAAILYNVKQRHFELMWAYLTETARYTLKRRLLSANGHFFFSFRSNIDNVIYYKSYGGYETAADGNSASSRSRETEHITLLPTDLINQFIDLKAGKVLRAYGSLSMFKNFNVTDVVECAYLPDGKGGELCDIALASGKSLQAKRIGDEVSKGSGSSYKKFRYRALIGGKQGGERQFVCSRVIYAIARNISYTSLTMTDFEVDHIDDNSKNNDIANLQLVTSGGNSILKKVRKAIEELNDNEEEFI